MKFPVSFSEKAATAKSALQISAGDLDANFHFAALQADTSASGVPQPFLVNEIAGDSGRKSRQLIFNPPPPLDGKTYVLGFAGGRFQWLPTEEC